MKPHTSKPIGIKETDFEKTSKIPIKIIEAPIKAKPHWIKMQLPQSQRFNEIKSILRKNIFIAYVKKQAALILVNALVRALRHL